MKVAHLTTVDLSLRFLVFPQLVAVVDAGGEALGVSAPGPWVPELEAAGIRHVAISSSTRGVAPLDDLRAARQLWRVLRREKPDILHTHNPKPGLYGRVLGRLAGVPVVVNTVHGLYASPDDPPTKRLVVYCLEWFAARFSDAELVQNPEDLQLMRRWRIAPRRRLSLLGNGVELTRFHPAIDADEREAIRADLGLSPDQVAVGIVGRLVAEKGFLELFEAVQRLPSEYIVFAIGPEDTDKADALSADVLDEAKRAGVRFLGMRTDIDRIYRGLDLFVLPSHREGFPRAAMEAAASGLPVIATDIRGCREVVKDGVNGVLIPVRDPISLAAAITDLGADKEAIARMGAASIELARELFDESAVVKRVLSTYRQVAIAKGLPDLARSFVTGEPPVTLRRALPRRIATAGPPPRRKHPHWLPFESWSSVPESSLSGAHSTGPTRWCWWLTRVRFQLGSWPGFGIRERSTSTFFDDIPSLPAWSDSPNWSDQRICDELGRPSPTKASTTTLGPSCCRWASWRGCEVAAWPPNWERR